MKERIPYPSEYELWTFRRVTYKDCSAVFIAIIYIAVLIILWMCVFLCDADL